MDSEIPPQEPVQTPALVMSPPSPVPSHTGPPIMVIVLSVIALFAVSGGAYLLGMSQGAKSQKIASTVEIPQSRVTSIPSPTPTVIKDEMAEWKTYTSVYEGASFQYPPDWTLTTKDQAYLEGESAFIKSPTGLTVSFVPYITGLGGGCDQESCPVVKTIRVQPVSVPGARQAMALVEGSYGVVKRFGLMSAIPSNQYHLIPQVGQKQGFPYYLLFANHKGDQGGFYTELGDFNNPYPQSVWKTMTDEEFFALPEVKTAEKIITSLRYQ